MPADLERADFDGSALPAAVGTPPSLAIAAWAHYVADRLAQTTN